MVLLPSGIRMRHLVAFNLANFFRWVHAPHAIYSFIFNTRHVVVGDLSNFLLNNCFVLSTTRGPWTAMPALIKVDEIHKNYMKKIFISGAIFW